MSRGVKNSNVDRVIELFSEKKLYKYIAPTAAFFIELILSTGATPIDIINIKPKHIDETSRILTLHPYKKKLSHTTQYTLSEEAIAAYRALSKKKPLHQYSIRRIQQIIKEETSRIGSSLGNPRSLRKQFLAKALASSPQNIAEVTQLTSIQRRVILSKEDQEKLLHTSYATRDKELITTLLLMGLRISEVLQLQAHHIQKKNVVIDASISFDGKERIIPKPQQLVYHIKKGYLFSRKGKKALTQRRFEQICKDVAEECGLEQLNPSIIRATAIHNLSSKLSSVELLSQTGLRSNTLYTHGLFLTPTTSSVATTHSLDDNVDDRKDEKDNTSDEYMYHRSKLRNGGDTDE